jgi:type II secretory pathway pseudopilin PulG
MVAIILIAIIAVGGMSYLFYTAQLIQDQKESRVASMLATRRLELVMATSADILEEFADDVSAETDDYFYLTFDADADTDAADDCFDVSSSLVVESVTEDEVDAQVRIYLRYIATDSPGKAIASVCVEITIQVNYGNDFKRSVTLKNYHTSI